MRKLIIAGLLGLTAFAATASTADAQWRRGRDRVTIIERDNGGLNLNGGTLAAILAIQLARRASERETVVTRERQVAPREYVPLK